MYSLPCTVYHVSCTVYIQDRTSVRYRSPCLNGVNRNGNNTPCLGKYRPYRCLSGDRYYVCYQEMKKETRLDLYAPTESNDASGKEKRKEPRRGSRGGRKKGTNRLENDQEQQNYVFLSRVSGSLLRFQYTFGPVSF